MKAIYRSDPDDPFDDDDYGYMDSPPLPVDSETELTDEEFLQAVLYTGNLYWKPLAAQRKVVP